MPFFVGNGRDHFVERESIIVGGIGCFERSHLVGHHLVKGEYTVTVRIDARELRPIVLTELFGRQLTVTVAIVPPPLNPAAASLTNSPSVIRLLPSVSAASKANIS